MRHKSDDYINFFTVLFNGPHVLGKVPMHVLGKGSHVLGKVPMRVLGKGPHVLGKGLHVLGNTLHMFGNVLPVLSNGLQMLGNRLYVGITSGLCRIFGIMSFGIMAHSGLCRIRYSVGRDYVIRGYVVLV